MLFLSPFLHSICAEKICKIIQLRTLDIIKRNKMFYLVSIILFIIIHHFLIHNSDAIKQVDDNMLIAYMKGAQQTKINEYSMQKYEAHLGIVYFMRKNWYCDKIWDGFEEFFEEFERTECQKYRKYLDILYEYLCREYFGIPTVMPKFVFKDRKNHIEIEGPIIYAVNCLCKISNFYSIVWWNKLKSLFHSNFEPKLLNEDRLNYGIKLENKESNLPINEMILELAIDTANECQTNENLEGIIRQNFDKKLEEMLKKADERAKEDACLLCIDKHFIILGPKYNDQPIWVEDALFSEFVKGQATNLDKFISLMKIYNNFEKVKEDLMQQQYETHLCISYFTKNNLQCDKIVGESREIMLHEECQKHRKYLQIIFEYLFRLYAEGKKAEFAKKLPAVKPLFKEYKLYKSLIDTLKILNGNSEHFWEKSGKKLKMYRKLLHLENEEKLNYVINEEKNLPHKNIKKEKQILNSQKGQQSANENEIIESIRREFEQKMEKMCEKEMKEHETEN